jgi:hypothetical protein
VVLLIVESFDPAPYSLFELAIATKDAANMKESVEGVLRRREILFELRGASAEEISYEVKLPMNLHTDKVSEALMSLVLDECEGIDHDAFENQDIHRHRPLTRRDTSRRSA